ncbi:ECF transporter S component [Butyricicoccus sp. Marseille-Q5471]|uniref:ECF transporter S component n=1 Tax=Butyricicoccus sp. Marseille-Q5471 TaxID=3039493 RepID=UPI0024BC13B3|nr:ECF transporter S component [Butyricicoccus sp. Marseille-Q5471]
MQTSKKKDIRYLTQLALLIGIVIVLANTPLGMIQLPIIKATTIHIPVILGAILLGPAAGAILGATFGICSLVSNTIAPTLLSFAFSPFMSTTGLSGAVKALWISVGCRVLIGVAAGWLWIALKKLKWNDLAALPLVGFVGSMVNTVCVMGSIYVLFAQQYAQAKDVALTAVFGLVMGTVTASGIPEAIAAAVLVAVIGKALLAVLRKNGRMVIETV